MKLAIVRLLHLSYFFLLGTPLNVDDSDVVRPLRSSPFGTSCAQPRLKAAACGIP